MNGAWFIRVKAVVPQSRDGWVSTSNDPVLRLNWRSSFGRLFWNQSYLGQTSSFCSNISMIDSWYLHFLHCAWACFNAWPSRGTNQHMECKELSQQLQCSQKFAFLKVQTKMVDNITHKNTLKLSCCLLPSLPSCLLHFKFVQGTKLTPHGLHSTMWVIVCFSVWLIRPPKTLREISGTKRRAL